MKGALAGAWLAGTALVIWRQLRGGAHVVVPGSILAVTGLFAVLGVAADVAPAARQFIVVTAWGIDAAGVLNLWPSGLGGQVEKAAGAGTGGAAGSSAPAAQPKLVLPTGK